MAEGKSTHRAYVITYQEDGKEVARVTVQSGLSLLLVAYWYDHRELFEMDLKGRLVLDFDAARPSLSPHAELDVV